jgi:hypothetical protein
MAKVQTRVKSLLLDISWPRFEKIERMIYGKEQKRLISKKWTDDVLKDFDEVIEKYMIASPTIRNLIIEDGAGKRYWQIKNKGWGWYKKRDSFNAWYLTRKFPEFCVYRMMGKRNRCIYIGRTGGGGDRPAQHFEKTWFSKVSRIEIYPFASKSKVPRFECLLSHRDYPERLFVKPSMKAYHAHCPICDTQTAVRKELLRLFPVHSKHAKHKKT